MKNDIPPRVFRSIITGIEKWETSANRKLKQPWWKFWHWANDKWIENIDRLILIFAFILIFGIGFLIGAGYER